MKTNLPGLLVLGLLITSGCFSRYDITMTNDRKITAYSKPKLVDGVYVFKDAKGEETSVFQGRVRQIERQ